MMSPWKFSESPLVDGDRLLCTPGGAKAGLVALKQSTGETAWACALPELGERGKDGAGYSSMVAAEIEGVRQYIQIVGRGAVGVAADTGRFLWGYNRIANDTANIPTPVVRGNYVFVTTSYKTGSALLKIVRSGDAFRAEEVYFLGPETFENHHGGVVLKGGYVYGGDGQNQGGPVCLHLATGEVAWKPKSPGRGSAAVLYADGHLLFRYDRGEVFWIEADPRAFRVQGRFKAVVGEGPAWAYPVIHEKKLYLRHADILACYDLAKPGGMGEK
jgi:outer membrane protein assembly factor BamB